MHGVFRGGTSFLPTTSTTSVLLSSSMQICYTEHYLKDIEGNSKKWQMNALHSTMDSANKQASYFKPSAFQQFMKELNEACSLGDQDAKLALAPDMAKTWKKHKEWDKPELLKI